MKKIDIIGQKFNRLLVIEEVEKQGSFRMVRCLCDCGNTSIVSIGNLRANRIFSCGCYRKEVVTNKNITHNQRHTRLYEVWKAIKQRCLNPKCHQYKNYGARGVSICEEWENSFEAFYAWSYKNGYSTTHQTDEKQKLTIDRIDVNGNYEPSNCRWTTRKVQASNMRTTKLITIGNETHCVAEWCRIYGLHSKTYYSRINKGMSPEEALTK